ncbi:unnamed protein product [Gongylonema pulchrum]|uniref:Transmembrane protein n=1 Tax=Gongylonema pulchrum TaxID=637853 RepID=A0A183ELL4_9BILA|nr:unnamed protein product [Gongylonema pulchrum]
MPATTVHIRVAKVTSVHEDGVGACFGMSVRLVFLFTGYWFRWWVPGWRSLWRLLVVVPFSRWHNLAHFEMPGSVRNAP